VQLDQRLVNLIVALQSIALCSAVLLLLLRSHDPLARQIAADSLHPSSEEPERRLPTSFVLEPRAGNGDHDLSLDSDYWPNRGNLLSLFPRVPSTTQRLRPGLWFDV
jgi:hypothetical protein